MSETDAILFANEAFYRAFAGRDVRAMDELWSRTARVSCLHPGWAPLFGREEVMASWAAILAAAAAPAIRIHAPSAAIYGDCAAVVCFEELSEGFLAATNLFVRESRLWKMVHHQAGPTAATPPTDSKDESSAVH